MLFRAGMRLILAEGLPFAPRMEEAGSLTEALAIPGEVQLVLLDIQLPGVNGVQGLALLKRRWPQAAIVMLSAQEDRALIQEALRRGAAAFLSKSAPPSKIVELVMAAAEARKLVGDVVLEEAVEQGMPLAMPQGSDLASSASSRGSTCPNTRVSWVILDS